LIFAFKRLVVEDGRFFIPHFVQHLAGNALDLDLVYLLAFIKHKIELLALSILHVLLFPTVVFFEVKVDAIL
jgi:hypothetical protein